MSKENVQVRTIPFINPPRCEHAVTISRHIVWLGARRIEHVARRSDGAGHQAPFTTKKGGGVWKWNQKERYWFKNVLLCYLKAGLSALVSAKPEVLHQFAECSCRSLFIFISSKADLFSLSLSHARRPCMYQNVTEPQNTLEEAGESYIWQSAANKV